jgi:LuxR family transcriptional regulator, maltose regulon positive regulatory protein
MAAPILATKLYVPQPRPGAVPRARLLERLNAGLRQNESFARKLTLISAPAGFGKTALLAEWIAGFARIEPQLRVAWLSLDERDGDPARFLAYLAAALLTVAPDLDAGVIPSLRAPEPPELEPILTALLNEIAALPSLVVLVLDDYHLLDSQPVDQALAFLVEHLPSQLHLAIATREDPGLPLARLRGRGQLVELRAADLRFAPAEAAEFLTRAMSLDLPADDVAALEERTEGWIAGLQLAALALQGTLSPSTGASSVDRSRFIASFTGGHRFVLDYLVEEVLQQQTAAVQSFLLQTSILDRLCGPLCDAVLQGDDFRAPSASGQATLEYLERANLFVVPLDGGRRWYRYHHLFSTLLRQRLGQKLTSSEIAVLHTTASHWLEENGLLLEAFQHAAAAGDLERAERLIESPALGLHSPSVAATVLDWLDGLPPAALDAHPLLRVRSATVALMSGRTSGVADKVAAAERVLQATEPDFRTRDLIGQLACARATIAVTRYDLPTMRAQALRALAHLSPDNLTYLFTANWALASACQLGGDRAGAAAACSAAVAASERAGSVFSRILAMVLLGNVQQADNRLHEAVASYRRALELAGEHPGPNLGHAHLNLAQIFYEWNDLGAAEQHGELSLQLLRRFDVLIDRFILSEVFLARLKLAQGDLAGAESVLAESEQAARRQNFLLRLPEIAAAQVLVQLRLGNIAAAAELAQQYDLPLSQARVLIAQGDPQAALALLQTRRREVEAWDWVDERLKALVLQAVALHARGERDAALQLLGDALALAEPGGFVRTFVDEGAPMAELLAEAAARGIRAGYTGKLLAAFPPPTEDAGQATVRSHVVAAGGRAALLDPLSQRELDILRLISQGLSNQEIGARLFLALNTVKGHNRVIFEKLQVQNRTEAVGRGRELGLL